MDIYITGIPYGVSNVDLIAGIARVLHSPRYAAFNEAIPAKLNFCVQIHPVKRRDTRGRTGSLTLPNVAVGHQFMHDCGGDYPSLPIVCQNRVVSFKPSRNQPRSHVLENILRLPFVEPKQLQEAEDKRRQLADESIHIKTVQFGWECRDGVFSIEWERSYNDGSCTLQFDGEQRELRVKIRGPVETEIIAVPFSQIHFTATSKSAAQPALFFTLNLPPTFEHAREAPDFWDVFMSLSLVDTPRRQRSSSLADPEHARLVQYTALSMRLLCKSTSDIYSFIKLGETARLKKPEDFDYVAERRSRFSVEALQTLEDWFTKLAIRDQWIVAFQAEALLRNTALDAKELLELKPQIEILLKKEGTRGTAAFLRRFGRETHSLWLIADDTQTPTETVIECFLRLAKEFFSTLQPENPVIATGNSFDCYHVYVTPTRILMDGPLPDRSNRVIRTYAKHQECFIRVVFCEESRLQYRFDRQVDGPAFVKRRVGGCLHGGLRVAGKNFVFLAYSQSALKEHAVWFVTPFFDEERGFVDAAAIIRSLGTFHNLEFDNRLIYCPARYGARISQAFTSTDASVIFGETEEIFPIHDIKRHGSCFTDGVGTLSPQLAKDITKALARGKKKQSWNRKNISAFQIRFQGSKGMLSVDYRLTGKVLCLRPSMIKFEAPDAMEVEIARVFDKPGPMFLNRPLIMLLEGLGVPVHVFTELQKNAVSEVEAAKKSLTRAARLLETHGLGASFRLPSVLLSLEKLGIPLKSSFYEGMVTVAINHCLRELKHHARIPVPGWNLVGVADEHSYLEEGQVFACVQPVGSPKCYLRGPVVISRSPTIHPGDVQVVQAIGKPPLGSPFDKEPLVNTVVFSTKGDRSLPSMLGGGDLDGDTYNITEYAPLCPQRTCEPAGYEAATRKELHRPSTMSDVADFVVEYINSDILGIIAINWLIIADQSEKGIFDPDCLKLAKLHSDAVDFPKSGRPVPVMEVPRLKFTAKPDWNAPETMVPGLNHYESSRAIGVLYRAIKLPDLPVSMQRAERQRLPHDDDETELELAHRVMSLPSLRDRTYRAVRDHVSEFIFINDVDPPMVASMLSIFTHYALELQNICATYALSTQRSSFLTEEEAVIGTIAAKCSQPRKRKAQMSAMREHTQALVGEIRKDLAGDEDATHLERLKQAWAAWELSIIQMEDKIFGSASFWYICLGAIFDIIKAIQDDERADLDYY